MRLYDLKTNHETELLGIDSRPYFSWKMMSEEENTEQVSCRIVVKTAVRLSGTAAQKKVQRLCLCRIRVFR